MGGAGVAEEFGLESEMVSESVNAFAGMPLRVRVCSTLNWGWAEAVDHLQALFSLCVGITR